MKAITVNFIFIIGACFLKCFAQDEFSADYNSSIHEILVKNNIPGAAIYLIQDSIVSKGYYGYSDYETKSPVDENTLFGIGSISKTFLAAGFMISDQNGDLDIQDPLSNYLTPHKFENPWESRNPVRLIHLLEHTSGFDDAHFKLFALANAQTSFLESIDISKNSLHSKWPPGRFYSYNNLGYLILAHCLEKSVKMDYEDYIRTKLFTPLDMSNSLFNPDNDLENLSKGYSVDNMNVEPFPSLPQWPAGGLVTTLDDMGNFLNMFLDNGSFKNQIILDESLIRQMEKPETSIAAENNVQNLYGKGLMTIHINDHTFYGHNGQIGGFISEFGYSRELGRGYVILLNNRDGLKGIKEIRAFLLEDIRPENFEPKAVSQDNFDTDITGAYLNKTADISILEPFLRIIDIQFIKYKNGQLWQESIIGDKQLLDNINRNTFRYNGDVGTHLFFKKINGKYYMLGENSYTQVSTWQAYTLFYISAFCLYVIGLGFMVLTLLKIYRIFIKREKSPSTLNVIYITDISFLLMIGSVFLFDPSKLYSSGAILFFISSILFFVFSLVALPLSVWNILNKTKESKFRQYLAVINATSCVLIAIYLWYWEVIGLRTWIY